MSDLISRADLLKPIEESYRNAGLHSEDYHKIKRWIKKAQSVSAERSGEWIEREDWNGDYYYDCSVCGESFVLCDGTPSMNLYHYCPNCGARMENTK